MASSSLTAGPIVPGVVIGAGIGNDRRVNFIGKLIYRLLTLILAIPISKAIKKLIAQGWTAARPHDPPKDPKKADVGWSDAIIWAVISGAGTALGKLVTSKGAAGTWRAIIGTDPPGFEKDPEKQKAI